MIQGLPFSIKIIISIIWDILDFTIGRIPLFGTLIDFIGTILAIALWGLPGLLAVWEVFDPTDQLDAEIPTLTIIGVIQYARGQK